MMQSFFLLFVPLLFFYPCLIFCILFFFFHFFSIFFFLCSKGMKSNVQIKPRCFLCRFWSNLHNSLRGYFLIVLFCHYGECLEKYRSGYR